MSSSKTRSVCKAECTGRRLSNGLNNLSQVIPLILQYLIKKIKGGSHERPFTTLLTFTTTNYLPKFMRKTLLTFDIYLLN